MIALINDTGILVVVLAIVLLFGASQIPKLARNLGEASREFKKAQEDAHREATSLRQALPGAHVDATKVAESARPQP